EVARRAGDLAFVDARAVIHSFMAGPLPDEARFRSVVGRLIERTLRGRTEVRVRAYGEMVDVLWQDGHHDAALRVEELWNELANTHRFSLLCAYAMANFQREADGDQFGRICASHSHVIPAESYSGLDEDARAREITRLQQRERALESEIEQRRRLEQALRAALDERRRAEEELRSSEEELLRDISGRKLAEEALRHAKEEAERASRVKTDFLAVMSHELRTPLNAILGYHNLLEEEVGGPITSAQRTHLARIASSTHQLIHLIDQVLSLSRLEAGKEELDIEPVDIAALARETCAMIEPAVTTKSLALALELTDESVFVDTDAGKFRQILLNLLSNAVKFTGRGSVALRL
ncbi:MAG: histidine kinase dimerization/phospho-acceptor domain-containing protein, partial [Longimicrobiales bacterium]